MARFVLCFSIGLLAFLIGVATDALWLSINPPPAAPMMSPAGRHLNFSPQQRSHYYKSWTQDYESSDGRVVFDEGHSYASNERASGQAELILTHAAGVIERGPYLGCDGSRIGERVVAVFPPDELGFVKVSILLTEGAQLRSISSYSLHHALEFERSGRCRE